MIKILIGIVFGVVISQFGIVPIAKFIDRSFDAGVELVQVVVKKN